MRRPPAALSLFVSLPLAAALSVAATPAVASAQSAGSLGTVGGPGALGSSGAGSSGSSGSTGSGSTGSESGPCHNFFGNIPPGSLGPVPATGSVATALNSVLDTVASSVRRFPRWVTGTDGTIPVLKGATTVRQLVTGPTSPARTDEQYDIHGTDLGITFTHGDRTMVLFGDTFGRCGVGDDAWRSNVMLEAEGGSPENGLSIVGAVPTGPGGHAAALIQGAHQPNGVGEVSVIPTAALSTGDAMYMRVMSVRDWNAPGGWNTNYSALARSTDGGHTWALLPDTMRRVTDFTGWHPSVHFETGGAPPEMPAADADRWYGAQMSAFLRVGDTLYEYVTPSGRRGPAQLARVAIDRIEDPDAYEWFTGAGWAAEPTGHQVLPAPVEELSVHYNAHLGAYIAMYPTASGAVSARVSRSPEGPWSAPQTIVDRRMFPNGYAPMMHPVTSTTDSRYLYYTLSTWDAYNVFLLRTDLDAFDFSLPDADPRTVVEGTVPVSRAAAGGAVDSRGMVDERRLEEIAEEAPAAPAPVPAVPPAPEPAAPPAG